MDDNLFEWPITSVANAPGITNNYGRLGESASNTAASVVSLIADFGTNSNKRVYNKKSTDVFMNISNVFFLSQFLKMLFSQEYAEHASCSSQLVKKKDVISLSDCFNLYTKTEELSEQDYWYCARCKNHQPSTKKFDLWSMPQVLVIHLKRFSYSRLSRDKIDTLVEFPLTDLDMSSYLINKKAVETTSTKYDLIAVTNHYGSLGGGHCKIALFCFLFVFFLYSIFYI